MSIKLYLPLIAAGIQTDAHPSVNFGGDSTIAATPSAAPAPPQGPDAVSIDNFVFAPASLTVRAATTVTWTNHDEEPHTVVAGDGSFHSPGMGTGATYSYAFATAGSDDYSCSVHPFMHGTVVATP